MKDKVKQRFDNVGNWVASYSELINRNTGFLILLAVIIFGFLSYGQGQDTQAIVRNTETIVAKQDETLRAIQQVAMDNKLLSDQKTSIIICMLQVPVSLRTTDVLNDCREQAEAEPPQIRPLPATSQNTPQSTSSTSTSNTSQPPQEPTPKPLTTRAAEVWQNIRERLPF